MRSIARLLLLVAALAYGAMPMTGMSAMAMPVAHAMEVSGDAEMPVSASEVAVDSDCPHSVPSAIAADASGSTDQPATPLKSAWHCAACLTLPADPVLAESGKPARAAEAPARLPRLVSQMTAPLTPPPRA
ncbi:hypothetical protein H6M51_09450 [Rhizobium sp. AQ_MP]|uniref:hypothetical protein n=1 Tax=Rhizobium sp. AQ_MP TaxID=2761536 RepID=UPI0016395E67|nr:hypothetical protein [Rhizobium sp. AQ_MP]MBC2773088.1 hypothetical protein [Rhizobium sp. AQ_MP]